MSLKRKCNVDLYSQLCNLFGVLFACGTRQVFDVTECTSEGLQENEETLVAQLWPIQPGFRHPPAYKKAKKF
jgi:hypothetical protein